MKIDKEKTNVRKILKHFDEIFDQAQILKIWGV